MKRVFNLLVVDESGSMSIIERQALVGINETLTTIQKMQKTHKDMEQRVMEALETPPKYRKKGYASELLNEMITHLHQQGSVDIRDCVSKTNTASLATHKKCGFFIAEENGIYYPSNTVNNKTYGMRYFIR